MPAMFARLRRVPWDALALAGTAAVLLARFPLRFLRRPPYQMDFEVFRATALRVLDGQAHLLYAPTTSAQALFKYAPVWALGMLPAGMLPAHAAAVAWGLASVACLMATCWLAAAMCRRAGVRMPAAAAPLMVLLLTRPLTEEFMNGQVDTLWGALMAAAIAGVAWGRPWLAASALALAASLKLPALIVVAYLAVRGRAVRGGWGVVWRAAVVGVAVNVAAAVVLRPSAPWSVFAEWLAVLRDSAPDRAFEIGSQSLLALVARLVTDDGYPLHVARLSRGSAGLITLALEAALFAWLVWPRRGAARSEPTAGAQPAVDSRRGNLTRADTAGRSHSPAPEHASLRWLVDAAALVVMAVLFSPTCWLLTYTQLALPWLVAIALAWTRRRALWRDPASLLSLTLAVVAALLAHNTPWRWMGIDRIAQEQYVFLVVMTLPWMGLALLVFLLRQRAQCA
jgi:hypothetical protein